MKALKSIFSAFLALLVVLSSFSLTIDRHLCMGKVHSVSILKDAPGCGMELSVQNGQNLSKMEGCCQDEQTVIEGHALLVKTVKPVSVEYQSLWVAELPHAILTLDFASSDRPTTHAQYKPPLIDREIPLLVQSFLI